MSAPGSCMMQTLSRTPKKQQDASRQELHIEEAKSAAHDAGLRYVNDNKPGVRRVRQGKGFVYLDENNKRVKDADTLLRIRYLAIPPAWEDVWICPWDNGHIQAVGRD